MVLAARPGAAQVLPVTVPKGVLRFDFDGEFRTWDWRWHDGTREEWADPLSQAMLGRTAVAGVGAADSVLRRITGLPTVALSVGSSRATALVNYGTIGFGGSVGLTRRLTVFGRVPFVQAQVRSRFTFDGSTATAGLAVAGANQGLLDQLGGALGDLSQAIASGAFDADPARKALAQQTLDRGSELQADLGTLLGGSPGTPFAPLESSAAGMATATAVTSLAQTLESLGIATLTAGVVLPTAPLSEDEFNAFVTDPAGPVAIRPITGFPILSTIGDVELGAAYALVDRFPESDYATGIRSVVRATVRLPTATLDRPSLVADLGTGDRQLDLQGEILTDFTSGRFGARVTGGYNLQLAGTLTRRVAPLSMPFPPAASLATVRRDPGDVWWLGAQPFVRLAPYLSLGGTFEYYTKGRDGYRYAGQAPAAGVDPDVLSEGSRQTAVLLGGALSYAHSGLDKRGRQKMPMEASIRYQRIVTSSDGIVPDANQVLLRLRFYTRLWR